MKRIALAAAAAAVAGLTACSHTAAPSAAPRAHPAVRVPVSCGKQYRAWQDGAGKGLVAALSAISAAGAAGKAHALETALATAGPTVARAARHPIPACADPRGYWDVLLMHVNAAAASKAPAASVRAAMKGVPQLVGGLRAELAGTVR